jgi:sugar lactone lactonase YvrE
VELTCATRERYVLAEGPAWDPVRRELLWVDVEAGLVVAGRLGPDDRITVRETVHIAPTVGAVAVTADGSWVVAGSTGLHIRTPDGVVHDGQRLLPEDSRRRLNDAKADPAGRLLVGTLALVEENPVAEALLIVGERGVALVDGDLTLSNGLAWAPDGRTLFSVDTLRRVVYRRRWDPAAGTWGQRSVHIAFEEGYPDGICVDAVGCLWVAMWGIGEVRRHAPDGTVLAVIPVPAPHVSSVTFAGADLDVLVITTSYRDLSAEERLRHPGAGALFTGRPGVRGLDPNLCGVGGLLAGDPAR